MFAQLDLSGTLQTRMENRGITWPYTISTVDYSAAVFHIGDTGITGHDTVLIRFSDTNKQVPVFPIILFGIFS